MHTIADLSRPTILALHPDPFVGIVIEELLVEAGAGRVVVAFNHDEAEEALAAERFSAAVLGVYVDYSEILPLARILNVFAVPFVVWGALTYLPDLYGLNKAPVVSALAKSFEFTSAFAAIGIL